MEQQAKAEQEQLVPPEENEEDMYVEEPSSLVDKQIFENWVSTLRKKGPSGSPRQNSRIEVMPSESSSLCISGDLSDQLGRTESTGKEENPLIFDQRPEISLWKRLGNAAPLDIESSDFSWCMLSSLHRSSSSKQSEDKTSKAIEVTVNSGGEVFFAIFNSLGLSGLPKETAAVIKFASSKMAIQAERLGYEFARLLRVKTPQAQIVYNSCEEWQQIRHAAENARAVAISNNDEVGEMTCSELLEALELSRCLLLMSYIHGSPLLENSKAFNSVDAACITASSLGRVLMLDLILRNEDRLPCRQLGWRGNPGNLMISDKSLSPNVDRLENSKSTSDSPNQQITKNFQREKRSHSESGIFYPQLDVMSSKVEALRNGKENEECTNGNFHVVAIDTGVPRRPPEGRRVQDRERYPKVVELIVNSSDYCSNILYEISCGKLGQRGPDDFASTDPSRSLSDEENAVVIQEFRRSFLAARMDLEAFLHLFLRQLYQKLDRLFRDFVPIISERPEESKHNDAAVSDFPPPSGSYSNPSPPSKQINSELHGDSEMLKSATKSSSAGSPGSSDIMSPMSWHSPSLRMTKKLRDFSKLQKVDPETLKKIEQWNEVLKSDVIRLCHKKQFHCGFFDGTESNMVGDAHNKVAIDAYNLKIRLEHIIQRISLISEAASREPPSLVVNNLFIGGALAAKSKYTLQHLGITHVLCLCSNGIGQTDAQFPDLLEYKNFSISDDDDANISGLFYEASDFIGDIDSVGGKVLVHCHEGKSRSATVVLAYLMLRKGFTLATAWNLLKKVHHRAQPNNGFATALQDLDKKLHGKVSMDWRHKRPVMKACPICSKKVGLSRSSLKLHLQKAHKRLAAGSVDSATATMEIQKSIESLRISRGGSP